MGLFDKVKDNVNNSYENMKANRDAEQQQKAMFEEQQNQLKAVFRPIKRMGDIEIDESNKLLKINNATSNVKKGGMGVGKASLAIMTGGISIAAEAAYKVATSPGDVIFKFEEIRDYQLLEDDVAVTTGGKGSALAGGLIAGPVGGVVGGMVGNKKTKKSIETLALQISTSNLYFPSVIITYIKKETKTKSNAYANALSNSRQTMSCIDFIIEDNKKSAEPLVQRGEVSHAGDSTTLKKSAAEELKEMKELLDMGIINQEEFEEKKKNLLNL